MHAIEFETVAHEHFIRLPDGVPDGVPLRILVLSDVPMSAPAPGDLKSRLPGLTEGMSAKEPAPPSDPRDVTNRLEELADLRDGWLDGRGRAPDPEHLRWLARSFDSRFDPALPLPYLYPTAEGGIQAEWTLENWEASLEIDLHSKSAAWQAFNLVTQECREQDLDLSTAEGWRILNRELQTLSPESA